MIIQSHDQSKVMINLSVISVVTCSRTWLAREMTSVWYFLSIVDYV